MSHQQSFQLMGSYNQWINNNLYEVSSSLSAAELAKDRGAFFDSILGTLNHLLVADTIWLKRFSEHPSQFAALQFLKSTPNPSALSEILHADFSYLRRARQQMDASIMDFVQQATDADYDHYLSYKNTKGTPHRKKFSFLVYHFFNHQTHHRGQLTVLLSQLGLSYGSTDLLAKIPEAD